MTNISTKWAHRDFESGQHVCDTIPLESVDVNFASISRIEMDYMPIFYLLNGTVVAYGLINGLEYGCVV